MSAAVNTTDDGEYLVLSTTANPAAAQLRPAIVAALRAEYVDQVDGAVGDYLESSADALAAGLGPHAEAIVERCLEHRMRKAQERGEAAAELALIDQEMADSWPIPRAPALPAELKQAILAAITREYVQDEPGAVGRFLDESEADLTVLGRSADRIVEHFIEKPVRRAADQGGPAAAEEAIETIRAQDWCRVLPPPRCESDDDSESSDSESGDSGSSDSEEEEQYEDPSEQQADSVLDGRVRLFGVAAEAYLCSHASEGEGMMWGSSQQQQLLEQDWRIERCGPVRWLGGERFSQEIHIESRSHGECFHSNHGQGLGMSWGSIVESSGGLHWRLEWEGALCSGGPVHLFGMGQQEYFLSDHAEGQGMSWGSLEQSQQGKNWRIEWNEPSQEQPAAGTSSAGESSLQDASDQEWASMILSDKVSVAFFNSIGALGEARKRRILMMARASLQDKLAMIDLAL